MQIIAFHTLKGGTGKTSAAVNVAYLASQAGISTVVWDLDPQGAATWLLSQDQTKTGRKLGPLVKGKKPIGDFIHPTPYSRLELIPAHRSARNLDIKLSQLSSTGALKRWLQSLSEETALVILDCPPSLSELAEQVLHAANAIFVPVVPARLSINSWHQMRDFAKQSNIKAKRLRPFLSMVDRRKTFHKAMADGDVKPLPKQLQTAIPNAGVIERTAESRQPVELMDQRSGAAAAYRSMWAEIHALLKL